MDFSSRSCCNEDAKELQKRNSRTAAASPGEMRTISRWALSPMSVSWISTSTSKRRLKVSWAALLEGKRRSQTSFPMLMSTCLWCLCLVFSARKESAKEKQLKEEEKILESVAEGRGIIAARAMRRWTKLPHPNLKHVTYQEI